MIAFLILFNLLLAFGLALWLSTVDSLSIFASPVPTQINLPNPSVVALLPGGSTGQSSSIAILTTTPTATPSPQIIEGDLTATVDFLLAQTATAEFAQFVTPSPTLPPPVTIDPIVLETVYPDEACTVTVPAGWQSYTVRPGDTLFRLSAASGASVAEIIRVNCLEEAGLVSGTTISLPQTAAAIPTVQCGAPVGWVQYVVQPVDTVFSLAQTYGTTVNAILLANCLTSTRLFVGQVIVLPPLTIIPSATPTLIPTASETFAPTLTSPPAATSTHTATPTHTPDLSTSTPTEVIDPSSTMTPTRTLTPVTPTVTSSVTHTPPPTPTATPLVTSRARAQDITFGQFSGTISLLSIGLFFGIVLSVRREET